MSQRRFGFKRWRFPKVIASLLVLEFPLTVAALALFGIADPDTYRDLLWQDGFDNGFNSSPAQPLYDMTNGKPSKVPLVWSDFVTKFNLVISVLSMFILLAKTIMATMKILYPAISFWLHGLEIGLYAYSVHAQTSPDTIDPEHRNPGPPWYITKSCSVTKLQSNVGFCKQAKAAFYVAVFMVALFGIHMLLSLHSMALPPPKVEEDDEETVFHAKGKGVEEPDWEMVPIPKTPGSTMSGYPMSPITPRTKAFRALDGGGGGGLPLRDYYKKS